VIESLLALFRESSGWRLALAVLDIGIVYYAIYRALVLIRGTRAVQTAVGLGLVFLVYYLSRRLGLVTLQSILDLFVSSVVLIIVVLFQHDIRRALIRFGRRPLFTGFAKAQETHAVEEVIKAAAALAQKKIGALVVFERDANLDDFIEPGTPVDSLVSREILHGIFVPSHENPVHDGAVIIRKGRIAQAGAFLPLSANPRLDKALGTRHRAAIGITEETDAIVVLVSEERGKIGLCFHGNLVKDLDATSLRSALLSLLFAPRRSRSRSRASAAPHPPLPEKTHAVSEAGGES
jgi:uncharacterized protein (TIGR00159 family)